MFSIFKKTHYVISHAKTHDADAISKLHKANFAHGWSSIDIAEMIAANNTLTLIAHASKGGEAKAFLIVRFVLDEAEILSIAVDKSLRRQKIAARLLDKALPELLQRRVTKLFLEVASDNLAAIKLYQNYHFTQISMRKNYYQDKDALVMQRNL